MWRPRLSWTVLVVVGLVLWSAYFAVAWARDWFTWFGAVDQLAILLLGVLVTLAESWTKDHKILILVAFGVLGLTGTIAVVIEGKSADADRKSILTSLTRTADSIKGYSDSQQASSSELGDAIDRLSQITSQGLEISTQTVATQKQLLGTSETITRLSLDAINMQTGGDSYCYLAISSIGPDGALPSVIHIGKYPLYGVRVRVVDLDNMPPNTVHGLATGAREIGDIAPHAAYTDITWRLLLGDKQERSFNVFFGAKNGFWTQRYRLRKVDGQWRDSVVVDRLNFRTNNYEKIMDKTDPLFGPAMP